jgi:hypothetical protein
MALCVMVSTGPRPSGTRGHVRGLVDVLLVFGRRKTKHGPCAFVDIPGIGAWRAMQGAINTDKHIVCQNVKGRQRT